MNTESVNENQENGIEGVNELENIGDGDNGENLLEGNENKELT